MNHVEPLKSLQVELLLEASGRSAAHKRVLVQRTYSKFAISLMAFFIVCTSILTLVFSYRLTALGIIVLSCATIFAAIYSLIVDNLESSKNYSEKAFRMEKSAVAMKRLRDRLSHFSENDAKAPIKQIEEEKSQIIETFGEIYSITDLNYAKWLNQKYLKQIGVECDDLDRAEHLYLQSRFKVFWAYLIFPILLLVGSFFFVVNYAVDVSQLVTETN